MRDGFHAIELKNFFISCDVLSHSPLNTGFPGLCSDELEKTCFQVLRCEDSVERTMSDIDINICDSFLQKIQTDEEGRFTIPILWEK